MAKTITTHLNKLLEQFDDYFNEKQRGDDWIHGPFGIDMESVTLASNEERQRVEP